MSEFIKYQGNIAGTGSISLAGALVPLITTDKKPWAEGGGGGREGSSARDSGSDYRTGSKQSGPGVLKAKYTAAKAMKFRNLHTAHAHIITDQLRRQAYNSGKSGIFLCVSLPLCTSPSLIYMS